MDSPERKLWSSVVLHTLNDYWSATRRAKGNPAAVRRVRDDALRYFRSRDGRMVLALAGVTTEPERMADLAVDLTAKARMRLLRIEGDAA